MRMNAVKPGTFLNSSNALRNAQGSGASLFGGVCGTRNELIAQRTPAPVEIAISETGNDLRFSLAHITAKATATQPMVPMVRMTENARSRSASVEPSSLLRWYSVSELPIPIVGANAIDHSTSQSPSPLTGINPATRSPTLS